MRNLKMSMKWLLLETIILPRKQIRCRFVRRLKWMWIFTTIWILYCYCRFLDSIWRIKTASCKWNQPGEELNWENIENWVSSENENSSENGNCCELLSDSKIIAEVLKANDSETEDADTDEPKSCVKCDNAISVFKTFI